MDINKIIKLIEKANKKALTDTNNGVDNATVVNDLMQSIMIIFLDSAFNEAMKEIERIFDKKELTQ